MRMKKKTHIPSSTKLGDKNNIQIRAVKSSSERAEAMQKKAENMRLEWSRKLRQALESGGPLNIKGDPGQQHWVLEP